MEIKEKKVTGFALLSPERRKELASIGGKACPNETRSFSKNKALAIEAGRLGGHRSHGGGRKPKLKVDEKGDLPKRFCSGRSHE